MPLFLTAAGIVLLFGAAVLGHRMTVARGQDIPLVFHHRAHGGFNCVTCHHDFLKPVVTPAVHRTCIACHKATPAVASVIHDQFHAFCVGCHLNQQEQNRRAGPVHECRACHVREAGSPGHGHLH
ncbi:hypothetical protein GOB93_10930 [Acetobacter musti]|uniref:Class III cytochrome C domain-containing protein n=1 Tax=Acetobacter musti TaxID=864732 RepID=A0ABX0JP10_9PROT|nr:hypothetical protein [Acetobacter musti]